jgi:outer membrane receptor protein involved in Fe transport
MRQSLPRAGKGLIAFVAMMLVVGLSSTASAQSASATLRGRAPPNGTVTAKNVNTGLTQRTTADANGAYTILGLPAGTYKVDAGEGLERNVVLPVAATITLDLQPQPPEAVAESGEPITVTVNAQKLTEVRTSEVGMTISPVQIQTVPQITRNFLEFADAVPGLVFSVDPGGNTSLRGGAQRTSSVNVFIDGVGQKSYVKEGGVSGQFFSQGNPFPQLAIGEYKVITSNYKAEYDQISSAAVTAETKSGTNQFHADVVTSYTADNFRARTPSEADAGIKTPSKDKEYGVAFGGPIIQDVAHFFVTYEGKRFNTPITVISSTQGFDSLLPADVAAQLGPASLPFDEDLYFGKVDWNPTDADRFVLSTKVRKETQVLNIGVGLAASHSIETQNDDTRIDLRWQRTADRWFNELLVTYEDAFNNPTPRVFGNGFTYTYQPRQDADIITVGASDPVSAQIKGQRGPGIQDDLTLKNLTWMGDHTVKGGVKLKKITLHAQDAQDINPQFSFDVNDTGTAAIPYKVEFTTPVPGLSPAAESRNTQLGLYLQDDWAPTEKLTLNLGVRWDFERTPSYLNHVTPANVVAALNSQDSSPDAPAGQTYAQSLAKGGVDVNDYISTGNNRKPVKDEWQPRLGFSYDLNADQAHVIFGGAGRSYDRDLYDYLALEQTKAALPQNTIFFNVPERPCDPSPTCIAWDPKYLNGLDNLHGLIVGTNAGQEVDMINNNLKVPYSDQFSLGMRNRIAAWQTSATVARVISKDGFAWTLGNRFPDGTFFQGGSLPFGNPIPGFGALIAGNNGIETRATQVLLSAEKSYSEDSRWGATFAYTYTNAKHNRDDKERYALDEPSIADYPFIVSNAASKHRFVATGTLGGPWGTTVATKVTLATPLPKNDLAFFLAPGQTFPNGGSGVPVGATPDNYLGYRDVDFQLTKDFDFAETSTVYARFDVLNVFNSPNFLDYVANWGSNGVANPNPVSYNRVGNITGVPRTFKLTMGFRF